MNIDSELDKFNKLIFIEDGHKYTANDVKLTSVTTFIDKYFKPPFDRIYHATHVAKREGKTVDEVLAMWEEIADYGKSLGTQCHNYAEMVMQNIPVIIYNDPNFIQRTSLFNKFWIEHFIGVDVWCEIQLYSTDLKIAGKIDLMFGMNKKLYLGDYKFNKEFKNQDHKFGQTKRLYKPFSNVWSNDFTLYSIQLSLYRYIIEKETNLSIEDCYIFSFSTKDHYEIFKANDYRRELDIFFKTF